MFRESKPLTAMVYENVYRSIINGEITCNDLLTESGISEKLSVSKAPVREALLMLCQESILQAMPRMGYRVLQITPPQVARLTEARALLEPYLLGKAWPIIGEVQILQVRNLVQHQAENLARDTWDFWQGNMKFHLLLAGFAENEYLLSSLERVLKTYTLVASQYFLNGTDRQKTGHDYHTVILQGMLEHDYEKTLNALKADTYEMV